MKELKEFNKEGILAFEGYLDENEKLNGPAKYYHENGSLKDEGQYQDGKREGKWLTYSETGKLLKKTFYKNGQEVEMDSKERLNEIKELEKNIKETIIEKEEREADHYYADSWEQAGQISDDIEKISKTLKRLNEKFKEEIEKLDDLEKLNYLKFTLTKNTENDLIKDEILKSLENRNILSKSENLENDIKLAEIKVLSNLITEKENEVLNLGFDKYIENMNNDTKLNSELRVLNNLKEKFIEKFSKLPINEKLNLLEENINNYYIKQTILDISEMENILPNREFINKENINFISASLKNETLDKTELNFILNGCLEKDEIKKIEELYQKGINVEQLEIIKNEVDKEKRDILFKVAEKDISTDKFKEITNAKENDIISFKRIAYELRNNYLYNNNSLNLTPFKYEITKENIENWLKTNPNFKEKGNFEIKKAMRDENRYGCIEANSELLNNKIKNYLKENNLEEDFNVKMKIEYENINIKIEKKYNLENKIQEEINKNKPKTFLEKIKNLINPKEINIDNIKSQLNEKYRNIEKVVINESSKLYKIENIKSFDKELNNIAKNNLKEIEKIRENIIPYKAGVEIKVNSWDKGEKTQNRGWGARASQKSGLGHGE